MHNEKTKVQASFSSCLGHLFLKIFNFFCVPLPLLVWLLTAWVSLCVEVFRNDQGYPKTAATDCGHVPHLFPSNCPPFHAMRPTQWDIARSCQCKQGSAAALDNCFRRSSTSAAFCVRSWSDSLMFDWDISGHARRSPGKTRVKAKAEHVLPICAYHGISAYLSLSISISQDFSRAISCNVSHTTGNPKCTQASAAALDNCFRKSSASSAFRRRSWSDSLMLESVHVWIRSGITREKTNKRKSQAYLA